MPILAALVAACASLDRLPAVPLAETSQALFLGLPNARFVIGEAAPAAMAAEFRRAYEREVAYRRTASGADAVLGRANYLAISGGSDNGAFGAGLLVGWSERGDRPVFKAVTGVSTGALSAPFAFLGPEYDSALAAVYTDSDAADIFEKRSMLAAISADAMADTAPLYRLISRHVDDRLVGEIAREYGRGRLLMVGTTNLDAGRPVVWNIGAIAASGHPMAVEAIRKILLASASVPGVFPPVMFDIEIGGKHFQEMHGDGGATAQAFLYPPTISLRGAGTVPARSRTVYMIRNGKLFQDWKETERKTLAIAGRAVSTMIGSSGLNDMFRIYATARRDGLAYRLAYIDNDFSEPYRGPFDRAYMTALFEYARAKARAGYPWRHAPPGLEQQAGPRTAVQR